MLRITGGKVYDPANHVAGEVRDVAIADGRIVSLWRERPGNGQGLRELKVMTPNGASYVMLVTGVDIEGIGCGG